jgi:hypothetical protein
MAVQGGTIRAIELFGAVDSALEEINSHLFFPDQLEYDRNLAAARSTVDDVTFNAAWAKGRAMTLEDAMSYALEESPPRPH